MYCNLFTTKGIANGLQNKSQNQLVATEQEKVDFFAFCSETSKENWLGRLVKVNKAVVTMSALIKVIFSMIAMSLNKLAYDRVR